jgi:hypothetical protein
MRSLLLPLALIGATSCSQVTGHIRGQDIVNLAAEDNAPSTCTTMITRIQAAADGDEVGVMLIEGSIFVSPAEMDRMLRAAGCQAGAAQLVVIDEDYGVIGRGSWARAAVFAKAEPAETSSVSLR